MTILLSDKIPFQILENFYQFLSFSLWFSGNPIRSGKWVSFYLCCGYVASLSDTSLSQSWTECEPGINYFLCVFFFFGILFYFYFFWVLFAKFNTTAHASRFRHFWRLVFFHIIPLYLIEKVPFTHLDFLTNHSLLICF